MPLPFQILRGTIAALSEGQSEANGTGFETVHYNSQCSIVLRCLLSFGIRTGFFYRESLGLAENVAEEEHEGAHKHLSHASKLSCVCVSLACR